MANENLQLVELSVGHRDALLAMVKEYHDQGDPRHGGVLEDVDAYIRRQQDNSAGRTLDEGIVPQTTYVLVSDGALLGTARLRHALVESLKIEDGHIGYDIRPSQRRKGYGTAILRLVLAEARKLGLDRVLVTCDIDNVGSGKIIRANGGVFDRETISPRSGKRVSLYWIDLSARVAEGEIIIRDATLEDIPGMVAVRIATWRTTYVGIVPDHVLDEQSQEKIEARWRQWHLEMKPDDVTLVAEDNGTVVGFAKGGAHWGDVPGYDGRLGGLYILKSHQRRGLGRRLVAAFAKRLAARGCRSLAIWVLARNPSRGFYERLGGTPVAEQPIDIGGVALPEVAYGWPDISVLFQAK